MAKIKQNQREAEVRSMAAISDKDRRRIRFKGGIAARALEHYELKYGKNPALAGQLMNKPKSKQQIENEQDAELEDLFDSVVEEIEERQEFLDEMGDQADKAMQEKLKFEICERVGELQKIRKIQAKGL